MKGKMIVIEACDASGKETQTKKLYDRLVSNGYDVRKIEFPNYESPSSSLVKMYLNGEFGEKADDVNPYIASTFYAVDRYASFKKDWESFYNQGGIIIADRYTTANAIHQASKIKEEEEKKKFLNWLWNFEYTIFGLPKPDCIMFLDMPPEFSQRLMKERKNKINGCSEKDIHEKDIDYLKMSYKNSCFIAEKYNWSRIKCTDNGEIKSIEAIHNEIYDIIKQIIS